MSPVNLYDLTIEQLRESLVGLGKERFRAQQLYQWVYQKRVEDFDQMSNLSIPFRTELKNLFYFDLPKAVERVVSRDGTIKILVDVGDGRIIYRQGDLAKLAEITRESFEEWIGADE